MYIQVLADIGVHKTTGSFGTLGLTEGPKNEGTTKVFFWLDMRLFWYLILLNSPNPLLNDDDHIDLVAECFGDVREQAVPSGKLILAGHRQDSFQLTNMMMMITTTTTTTTTTTSTTTPCSSVRWSVGHVFYAHAHQSNV